MGGVLGIGGLNSCFGDNCTLLFFIIVFLLLFWDRCGRVDP